MSKRKGAPLGNQNTVTHGFYLKVFDEDETQGLEEAHRAGDGRVGTGGGPTGAGAFDRETPDR